MKSLLAPVGVLWALIGATYWACLIRTGGDFTYAVDDAYIHLAIAKNIADHHVYGVVPYEFDAASSSIVWPLLLAAIRRVFGPSELAPLFLNVVGASALVAAVASALERAGAGKRLIFAASTSLVLFVPLLPLVFIGMEHTLHALAVLLLAIEGARALSGEPPRAIRLALLAAVAVSIRYESLFLLAPLVGFFVIRQRWTLALATLAGGCAPMIAQGIFSLSHGGFFFPTSVLIKRADLQLATALSYRKLVENPHVLVLLALLTAAIGVRARRSDPWEKGQVLLALAAMTTLLQVIFAQLGWMYRYEAYVMTLGLFALWSVSWDRLRELRPLALGLAVATLPIVGRGLGAIKTTIFASGNIHDQQIQMASFLRTFYQGREVVVNDIGAVTYFADVRLTDLMGLGSMRVARAKGMRIDRGLDRAQVEELTRGAAVAVIYDDWFADSIPVGWHRVARWKISDNRVCAKDTISFYAVDPGEEAALAEHLHAFAERLPPRVSVLAP
ncbi:MAG: hypothetical protein ABIP89_10500, partial [Polyangiaceae bacterium]